MTTPPEDTIQFTTQEVAEAAARISHPAKLELNAALLRGRIDQLQVRLDNALEEVSALNAELAKYETPVEG